MLNPLQVAQLPAAARCLAASTLDTYLRSIRGWLATCPDPLAPSRESLLAWLYAPTSRGQRSASGVLVRLMALRHLYRALHDNGQVALDPTIGLPRPRPRPPLPRGLEPSAAARLLAAPSSTSSGRRYRAYYTVALLTGLRFSELRQLRPAALDLEHGPAVFYRVIVKGGRERRRELPPAALEAITSWAGPVADWPPEERWFPQSRPCVRKALHQHCDRAGVPRISPHGLRHSAAALRRATGASLEDVSEFLGHCNLATTSRYLTRLERAEDAGAARAAAALGLDPHRREDT